MKTLVIILSLIGVYGSNSFSQPLSGSVSQPLVEAGRTQKNKSIEQRLLDLEQQQKEINQWYTEFYIQSQGRVTPFLGDKILLGGFFESGITNISGPDTPPQTTANSHVLGINIAAEFNDNIRFVAQFLTGISFTFQNPHNNPGLVPSQRQYTVPNIGALVANAYVEFRKSEAFIVQTGLGYAPFGEAFQQREPVLFRRRGGPQMTSASDATSVGIAFPLWMGLHVLGSFDHNGSRTGYDLYSFTPSTNPKTLGGGARLWWTNSPGLKAGLSLQTAEQTANSYYSYGLDLNVKWEKLGFVIEYAESVVSNNTPDLITYYFEPYYTFADGEWLVYLVVDYMNNPTRAVGAVADPYERLQYGGGVNWLPVSNVRFRLGLLSHDYLNTTDSIGGQRRDYYSLDFSAGTAF